jgi:hypothetical protein
MTLKQPFSGFVMSAWRQLSPKLTLIAIGALTVVAKPGRATGVTEFSAPFQVNKQEAIPFGSGDSDPEGVEPDQPPEPEQPTILEETPQFLRPQNACPRVLEPLMNRLLQDLPTYTELVAARSLNLRSEQDSPFGTVIIASEADYHPIELPDTSYGNSPQEVQQVFFTTLERQYWQGQPVSLQNHHWLFLAPAETGWYLSQMYSMVGHSPADRGAPSPPQESSDGIIGQAVTLWLRDCRAGAVFPPE